MKAIYTEKNNCQDCYKCVRRCPVKAIKIEEHSASIIPELCINCGYCTTICPAGAKKIRDDVDKVQTLIDNNEEVIACLAPAWASEFPDKSATELIGLLKQLGFWQVSEVALGAEIVSKEVDKYLQDKKTGIHISSCCPTVVSLIQKYYPEHIEKVIPLMSPMLAHATFLKKTNPNSKVVFIGPCIAKKEEADEFHLLVDAAITFQELERWLDVETPFLKKKTQEQYFYPATASDGSLYPVDGGMIHSVRKNSTTVDLDYMSFSGRNSVKDVLNHLDELYQDQLCFLELLTCNGGCINGPGCSEKNSIAKKRAAIIKSSRLYSAEKRSIEESYHIDLNYSKDLIVDNKHKEEEILDALHSIGKSSSKDYLNCSGCGYENCRDFAHALLEGKAERSMCVSYMRKVAQNKASVLLQKMPYGVVMCDEHLRIIESNKQFAQSLGSDAEELFGDIPGLEGARLKSLFPAYKYFKNFLEQGFNSYEKDIRVNNRRFHLSLFSIQKKKIICGILRDLQSPEVRNEEVVKRTKEVILENLSTVQQVAFLLGENAAKTESMLNSIVQSYTGQEDV